MFEINNLFQENSIGYSKCGQNLGERYEEMIALQEVCDYCRANDEKLECDINQLYEMEVEPGIAFSEWVFSNAGQAGYDERCFMRGLVAGFTDYETEKDTCIEVSLGKQQGCVCDESGYREKRREILMSLRKPLDFCDFMGSCFLNTVFADKIEDGVRQIEDFALHTKEIVSNLALLNDEALEIYNRHGKNEKTAMDELTAKALKCSGDPKHKKDLAFPFSYDVEESGEKITYFARIICSPHMKLIRLDSNLRIYFYWCDERIANGEKVLIGKIGSHPY